MDIQSYISSGILEEYVLGTVSSQEKQEVECMSHIYPEIKEELESLQAVFEVVAEKNKRSVPADVKTKLFDQLNTIDQDNVLSVEHKDEVENEVKVTPIPTEPATPKTNNAWKILAAAAIAVFFFSTYLYMNESQALNSVEGTVANLKLEHDIINKELEALKKEYKNLNATKAELDQTISFISDENTTRILLAGTEKYGSYETVVFYNEKSGRGYIKANTLPSPGDIKDYQLWAIVDGEPRDLGIINVDELKLLEIPNVLNPEAFAITLEQKGGSPTPTMEQMVVIGSRS